LVFVLFCLLGTGLLIAVNQDRARPGPTDDFLYPE